MWTIGKQPKIKCENVNKRLMALEGILSEKDAKIELVRFLKNNIGFASHVLAGVDLFPFQEIAIRAMFKNDYTLFVLSRGLGKSFNAAIFAFLYAIFEPGAKIAIISKSFRQCLAINELAFTEHGLKQMDSVNVGDKVCAIKNLQTVSNKWKNPIEKGKRIVTKKGYSIEGKNGHKILCFDDNLISSWKNIEDLSGKELVVIKYGSNVWGTCDLVKDRPIAHHHCSKPITIIQNNDLFYLMGAYLGDGHFDHGEINITSMDDEIIQNICRIWTNVRNAPPGIKQKKECRAQDISCVSVEFCDFLRHIGFKNVTATHKEIPQKILACSKEEIKWFLRGYYDTDGGLDMGKWGWVVAMTTPSPHLAKTLQILLLNFGIISTIQEEKERGEIEICGVKTFGHKSYKVRICGYDNLKLFCDEIGFQLSRKQKPLEEYIKNCKNNIDTKKVLSLGKYINKTVGKKCCSSDNSTRKTCKRIIEECGENYPDLVATIKFFVDNQIILEPIKRIEDVEVETVDITVENEECYLANGFINHNSRLVFQKIEEVASKPDATLMAQCLSEPPKHRNDLWELKFGNSEIKALPLGDGSKLRGFRFNVLIIDELLLMPEKIINEVIMPFLNVNRDPKKTHDIIVLENELIKAGLMKDEDRSKIQNNKMIGLSSASYVFEPLYKTYTDYIAKILGEPTAENLLDGRYAVMQLSYDTAPEGLYNKSLIEKLKNEMSAAQFKREMGSQFTDDSGGYFSAKTMEACSIPAGQKPCTELIGDGKSKYMFVIDPSYSESETSDFFAMAIYKLISNTKKYVQVHSYARAGGKQKEHISYFHYLYTHFNPAFIMMDSGGGIQFLGAINESALFQKNKIELKEIKNCDFNEVKDYQGELKKARREYNFEEKRIVYLQDFAQSDWIRRANEMLQGDIDNRRIVFAAEPFDDEFMKQQSLTLDLSNIKFLNDSDEDYEYKPKGLEVDTKERDVRGKLIDFIEHQGYLIKLTKAQCASIEPRITDKGHQQFGISSNLKGRSGPNRPRKDLYTTLLLGGWATRCYNDMMTFAEQKPPEFLPFFLK